MVNIMVWFLTPFFYCIGKVCVLVFGEFDVWETIPSGNKKEGKR